MRNKSILLDCTLRDGGYYNNWDFENELVTAYLEAMAALKVDYVEVGLRSLKNKGFKGGFAYCSESFLNSLNIPDELSGSIGVMVNASELINNSLALEDVLNELFTLKSESVVSLVRIACHVHEFEEALPAANWLKARGYIVGFNLMQIAERNEDEILHLVTKACEYPIDVLYFADSMGSLQPREVVQIVEIIRKGWKGLIGIHAHDNMSQAVANSIAGLEAGVTWIDGTVTGMGRGPGNAQTEYLTLALGPYSQKKGNPTKLFELIRNHFKSMQTHYGWGTNPYYYIAGQNGIHPSYIQEMLQDSRYRDEDILSVIEHLQIEGGKKFSFHTLEAARKFYSGKPRGTWSPKTFIQGRDVLILGTGPGVAKYRNAIENFIELKQPYVIALNTQKNLRDDLIDAHAACHPVRLLADCHEYLQFSQPLITPVSMLPEDIRKELENKDILDFGIDINSSGFDFHENYAKLPTKLVVAYALAIATTGQAKRIFMVGFDGYSAGDSRNQEMNELFRLYREAPSAKNIYSLTPTSYQLPSLSIFGLVK